MAEDVALPNVNHDAAWREAPSRRVQQLPSQRAQHDVDADADAAGRPHHLAIKRPVARVEDAVARDAKLGSRTM